MMCGRVKHTDSFTQMCHICRYVLSVVGFYELKRESVPTEEEREGLEQQRMLWCASATDSFGTDGAWAQKALGPRTSSLSRKMYTETDASWLACVVASYRPMTSALKLSSQTRC